MDSGRRHPVAVAGSGRQDLSGSRAHARRQPEGAIEGLSAADLAAGRDGRAHRRRRQVARDARAACTTFASVSRQDHDRCAPRRRRAYAVVRTAPPRRRSRRCDSPACRWATNSRRWCWRCCRPAAIRRRSTPRVADQIRGLDGDYHFETFVSLTCQSCPDVVQALNLMAVLNPAVRHTMIDGALFQDEVQARQVMAVPAVFLNGQPFGAGPHGARRNPRQAGRRLRGARGRAV